MTNSADHASGSERTLFCPMCGTPFTCALSTTCWCSTRKVPSELRDYLAAHYATCICSNCLDRLIEKSNGGESV
ncbi:MAG: cysteine-rich CWC family protein [Chlorobiaceae bacterium]